MAWDGHKKDKSEGMESGGGRDLVAEGWTGRVALLVIYRGIVHFLLPPPSNLTMVLLVTSDNEQFVVEKDVAERSVLIKNMLEGNSYFPVLSLLAGHPNAL
jgi:hypothetical protein